MEGTRKLRTVAQALLRRIAAIRNQEGMALVEVLVAVAITGGVVVMLLSSLSTGSGAVGIMYERTTAENLARSQLEYTKSQEYLLAPSSYDTIVSLPPDFTVSAEASAVTDRDDNIQKITVRVYRDGEPVLVKEDFKVNR